MSEAKRAIDRFRERIDQTQENYTELLLAVHGKRRQAALETMLAEQCAMSLAVLWEAFIHDVLIAYVISNPLTFKNDLEARLRQSIEDKFGNALKWTKFKFPKTPSKIQLLRVIDPKGWNITANSAVDLASRANKLLPAAEAKKFSLDADDSAFVDYLICLRNYLGHRSVASRSEAMRGIRGMAATSRNSSLAGPVTTIGAYLKTRIANSETKAHFIGTRLEEISEKLR